MLAHNPQLPAGVDDVLARATAKVPADRYQSVEELVADLRAVEVAEATSVERRLGVSTAVTLIEARNPYKGLRAFTEADAGDFYGRERLVDRLVDVLGRANTSGRIAAVVGPSGIGKSSAVRAGLLPALRAGAVTGSERWFIATMLPGSDPFEELAAALLRVATRAPDNLMGQLTDDERGIARVVKAVAPSDGDVLVVIDQFEELFTLSDDATTRRFLSSLEHALTDARCPLRVVLTMRADFWDRPLRHGSFARLIDASTVNVTALAPDELERAITEPAHRAGCEFEPGLISEIVAGLTDQPGALPLLQYALTELWDHRSSGLFTRAAYHDLGGVAGSVASRAEDLYTEADPDEQVATRQIMGRLVTTGEGSEGTRRRALRAELATTRAADTMIDRLGAARLLSFDTDPTTREPTVEIAHEALIRQWPRLRQWLEEDRDDLRILRHLHRAAREWNEADRPESELYRGGRLEGAQDLQSRQAGHPGELESEFLTASLARQTQEEAAERHRLRRLRRLLGALGALVAISLVAGAIAFIARGEAADQRDAAQAQAAAAQAAREDADRQADRAQANEQVAKDIAFEADIARMVAQSETLLTSNRELALLVAAEAHRLDPSPATLGAIQRTLIGVPRGWLGALGARSAYSSVDFVGATTVVAAGDGGVDIFDLEARELVQALETGTGEWRSDATPEGALVAIASPAQRWHIYDSETWDKTAEGSELAEITHLALSPDGAKLAVGLRDGTTVIHDVASGEPPRRLPAVSADVERSAIQAGAADPVAGLAWNPTSTALLVGGGRLWPAKLYTASGQRIGDPVGVGRDPARRGSANVTWAGNFPVISSDTVVARLDPQTFELVDEPVPMPTSVSGAVVAMSEDKVLSAAPEALVLVDFAEGTTTVLHEEPEPTTASDVALSPDGSTVMIAGSRLGIWSMSGSHLLGSTLPSLGPMLAMNDDGTLVASSEAQSTDSSTVVWDMITGEQVRRFEGRGFSYFRDQGLILAHAPSGPDPADAVFAVWTPGDDNLRLWPGGPAMTRGLSPDAQLLVNPLRSTFHVLVWDLDTGELVADLDDLVAATAGAPRETLRFPSDAEFTPDGRRLVVPTYLEPLGCGTPRLGTCLHSWTSTTAFVTSTSLTTRSQSPSSAMEHSHFERRRASASSPALSRPSANPTPAAVELWRLLVTAAW